MDWPCSGGINPVFMEEKHTRQQYPRCHFGAQTTKRPFFGPLANSAGAASRQTSNVIPGALRRGSVRGVSSMGAPGGFGISSRKTSWFGSPLLQTTRSCSVQ